ncbi:Hint domain-containing protein, partial [Methylobacterium sp. J-090]|uniref:Hint domain-containing protein n=1 Tax=Methylobacterium sp. J-090 TaxID=2836666 RepID=UPI001FB91D79
MASTQSFSRSYALESSSGGTGSDRIDPLVQSGGRQGEFILSDLPASSGSDNQEMLGDTPNDNLQVVQTVNGASVTFTNREYVGQLANRSGVVVRSFSAARNEYVYLMYSNDVYEPSQSITLSSTPFALCFVAGTRILTARGEVAVEDLRVGDSAITASGRRRTVTWTGHR